MLFGPPPPGLKYTLDLGDPSKLDAQAHAHEQRRVRLAHRPHHRDLADLRVGEDVLVVADTARSFPEAVADLQHLVVLAVLDVLRQRQLRRIVGDDGGQVLIDEAFETRAIAIGLNGAGGTADVSGERAGDESGGNGQDRQREAHGGSLLGRGILPQCRAPYTITAS